MMKTFDLDHAATTKMHEAVLKEMLPYLTKSYGNPSSLHPEGIQNKRAINEAKAVIANILHCDPKELIFTGSGTEATNLAIKGYAEKHPNKKEIITTPIEHAATLNTVKYLETQGYQIHYIKVDSLGFIDLEDLKSKLNSKTLLVSILWANNEIGVIQDIEKIAEIVHHLGSIIHVDAVQMLAHEPIDLSRLNVDMMSFSAHKIEGPKGIGLLYKKSAIELTPLIHGGNQELGLRSGTENVAAIIGFKQALVLLNEQYSAKKAYLNSLSRTFLSRIQKVIPCHLNGPEIGEHRLPGLLSLAFERISGMRLQFKLNQLGVYVSTGSACHSNEIGLSHVIEAIHSINPEGVIRISFGLDTDLKDVDYLVDCFKQAYESLI